MKKKNLLDQFRTEDQPLVEAVIKTTGWKMVKREAKGLSPQVPFAGLEVELDRAQFYEDHKTAILAFLMRHEDTLEVSNVVVPLLCYLVAQKVESK